MFNIVLIEPEIPPNTGNIGRLCLATGSTLHLVEPLGFSIDDRALKRAGLDYWADVKVQTWESRQQLLDELGNSDRVFYLTTKTDQKYWDVQFEEGDYLIFGRETKGLPESMLDEHPERCLTIPQDGTRSLNLATAVGIVLYEGVRQLQAGSAP